MAETAYVGIVQAIRRRIASGSLRPGDRVPSTREITREWGVAMATATKVLTTLCQEGLVVARQGIGTVVAGPVAGPVEVAVRSARSGVEVTRDLVVRTAIAIADNEGSGALSMRRIATDLGVATMSLYRHVSSKDELLLRMVDTVFADNPFPADPPPGWRAGLEVAARLLWTMFRQHPWAAAALSLTRPRATRRTLAYGEAVLRVLAGTGLDEYRMFQVYVAVFGYVRGIAVGLEWDAADEQETGITAEQHFLEQDATFADVTASGAYPTFVRVVETSDFDMDLDEQFEFGLRHLLDGFAASLLALRLR
ncbi:MAG: GntR family transcriptional regulator [Actinophytocola sp.]|uniref:TetR/AcrR family transcriptional regulator C-terminal domain-containing protein n=1 Tax=Actinophytocola sp. TaxID=1872138 RepID=UPI001329D323|nr:TetR/AcrR family transcriptional regulator C-terminal domain-containing protein [Actinophytocola sp.]MPZ85388.1 GntR family transcriptional regulator [Actinophytocola sp.]